MKRKRRTPKRRQRRRSGVVEMSIGKYRGQPIEKVVADYRYCDWLVHQPWFCERYGGLVDVLRQLRKQQRRKAYVDYEGQLVLPDGTRVVAPPGFWWFMKRPFKYGSVLVWIEPEVRDAA